MSVAGIDISRELDRAEQAIRIGRPNLALEITAKVLTAEPEHAGAHYLMSLSWAECSEKKTHRALESIVKAVRLQPDEPCISPFTGFFWDPSKKTSRQTKLFNRLSR